MACTGNLSNANQTFKISIPDPPTQEIVNSTITLVLFGLNFSDSQPYEVRILNTPTGYSEPQPTQIYSNWVAGVEFTGQQLFDLADSNVPGGLGQDGGSVQGAKFSSNSGNCDGVIGSSQDLFDKFELNNPDPGGIECLPESQNGAGQPEP